MGREERRNRERRAAPSEDDREQIWQRSFDDKKVWDGAGKVNRYRCEDCGFNIYTVDRVKGVTPMFLTCKAEDWGRPECDGTMHSAMYQVVNHPPPRYEWYRPSLVELETLTPQVRDHVERGGLLLRRIGGDPPKDETPEAVRVIVARCVICDGEFTRREIRNASACPKCGNSGLPMSPADDVSVDINWQELRLLTMWAERWANQIEGQEKGVRWVETIFAIARRLQEQYPSRSPLTLSAEFEQLKEKYPSMELHGAKKGGPLPPKIN